MYGHINTFRTATVDFFVEEEIVIDFLFFDMFQARHHIDGFNLWTDGLSPGKLRRTGYNHWCNLQLPARHISRAYHAFHPANAGWQGRFPSLQAAPLCANS